MELHSPQTPEQRPRTPGMVRANFQAETYARVSIYSQFSTRQFLSKISLHMDHELCRRKAATSGYFDHCILLLNEMSLDV
jgi:hypothetical protein